MWMKVILAMEMIKLTTDNAQCTGKIRDFKYCSRIINLKRVSLIVILAIQHNMHCTDNCTWKTCQYFLFLK